MSYSFYLLFPDHHRLGVWHWQIYKVYMTSEVVHASCCSTPETSALSKEACIQALVEHGVPKEVLIRNELLGRHTGVDENWL